MSLQNAQRNFRPRRFKKVCGNDFIRGKIDSDFWCSLTNCEKAMTIGSLTRYTQCVKDYMKSLRIQSNGGTRIFSSWLWKYVVSREAQFVCNAVMPSWLRPSSSAHKNSNFLPGKWWLIGPSSPVQTADTQLLNFLPPFIEMRKRHMKKLAWLLQRLILAGQKLHFSRTSLDRI